LLYVSKIYNIRNSQAPKQFSLKVKTKKVFSHLKRIYWGDKVKTGGDYEMSCEKTLVEKLVTSERIYDGRVISLRKDIVELPNLRTTTREVVEHPGAAAIVPLLEGNKILMIRQYRHATKEILMEIPAGTLEKGEKPEECASRELTEETGCKAKELKKIISCYLAPGYSSEVIDIYLATGISQLDQKPEADEKIQVFTMSLDEAEQKIRDGKIRDAKTIIGILHILSLQFRK
jgi:ADP-ribose pyrophosphatase